MINENRPLRVFADSKEIGEDNRIRVQGRANMTLLPDFYLVNFYNMSNYDLSALRMAEKLFVYGEGLTMICSGEIESIYTHWEGENELVTVSIGDGMTFWKSSVNMSIGRGAWVRESMMRILKGVAFGDFTCDDIRLSRGQVFVGRIADIIHSMALSVKGRAYITKGVLSVAGKKSVENVFTINDYDIINESVLADGVTIIKTAVRGFSVGNVLLYNKVKYRIITEAIDADNFNGEWCIRMTMIEDNPVTLEEMGGGW